MQSGLVLWKRIPKKWLLKWQFTFKSRTPSSPTDIEEDAEQMFRDILPDVEKEFGVSLPFESFWYPGMSDNAKETVCINVVKAIVGGCQCGDPSCRFVMPMTLGIKMPGGPGKLTQTWEWDHHPKSRDWAKKRGMNWDTVGKIASALWDSVVKELRRCRVIFLFHHTTEAHDE